MKRVLGCALLFALSSAIGANTSAVLDKIQDLEDTYAKVPTGLNCKVPGTKLEKIGCADTNIILLDRLDTMAYVYAVENATKQEVDHAKTVDATFLKKRNACKDAACLVKAYIEHTNDSLGGLSPHAR